jgi:hypothetical protein
VATSPTTARAPVQNTSPLPRQLSRSLNAISPQSQSGTPVGDAVRFSPLTRSAPGGSRSPSAGSVGPPSCALRGQPVQAVRPAQGGLAITTCRPGTPRSARPATLQAMSSVVRRNSHSTLARVRP